MTTDKDYKRELERFFGYELGFENYYDSDKYEALCCIINNEYIPIFKHDWFSISVLKASKSKYKDVFKSLIGEKPFRTDFSGIMYITNHTVPNSFEELCIINDLNGR